MNAIVFFDNEIFMINRNNKIRYTASTWYG